MARSNLPAHALGWSRPLLRGLVVLNLVYAAGIALLFVASLVAGDTVFGAMGVRHGPHRATLVLGMHAMMLVGLLAAFVVDRVLRQLLAIIETVRAGDPFVAGNARRLDTIAWWVLAGEVLRLAIGAIAWAASTPAQPLEVDIGFSLAPWLAVLLLFVLARVFAEGTRMRTDLEGTV
jgi:hypothetical protein